MLTPAARMRSEAAEAVAAHETIRRLRARRRAEIEQLVALANLALEETELDAVTWQVARDALRDACRRLDPDEREAVFWKLAA
jgi:hypothetical protein